MILKDILTKCQLSIRSVEIDDAAFILKLRLDIKKSKFLNNVEDSLEKQKQWIQEQRFRENDYYFIIEDQKKNKIGTVGLYDINIKESSFNWGRWIIIDNAPPTTFILSTYLIYYLGFHILGLKKAISDVRIANSNVINFHISYGAIIYKVDSLNIYYEFQHDKFPIFNKKFNRYLR